THAVQGVRASQSDCAEPKEIKSLYPRLTREFPDTNVLINNAGIMRRLNLHAAASGLEELTREIEINLNGTIRMTAKFLPHLKSKPTAATIASTFMIDAPLKSSGFPLVTISVSEREPGGLQGRVDHADIYN